MPVVSSIINKQKDSLPLGTVPLVLHRIAPQPLEWEDVTPDILRKIILHIGNNWVTFSKDASEERPNSRKNWLLTFDDGYASDYEIVFPILQATGVRAVFFVITERVGEKSYLTWGQIREMHQHGMIFGSHSHSHQKICFLGLEGVQRELIKSRHILEDKLGVAIDAFSFPYGNYSQTALQMAQSAGYSYCCCSDHGITRKNTVQIPRNSINSSMDWEMVLRTIEAAPIKRLEWFMEDLAKNALKNFIGERNYLAFRKLLSSSNK